MDAQTVIAKRAALELRSGMLVNLGIGLPSLVAAGGVSSRSRSSDMLVIPCFVDQAIDSSDTRGQ